MTELPPQDPWRGQAPPPPPYDPTTAFAPPPRPSWWRRQSTAVQSFLIAAVVLLCCGGLGGISNMMEDPPKPASSNEAAEPTEPAQDIAAPAPSTTEARNAPSPSPSTAAPTSAKPSPKPSPKKTTAPAVYYKNCDAVRAAGADPLYRGDPGYRTGLDRDLDGEACEPDGGNGDTGGGDSGGGDSGGGDNDPRFSTCAEANDHGYGPYVQGEDPEYYWYIDRDNDGKVCE